MLCDVTPLRRCGLRLKAPELPAPVRGVLRVEWMAESNFGHPVQVANVYESHGTAQQRALLQTMLQVQLVALADGALSLAGVELTSEQVDGKLRVTECRQVWRCVPVLASPAQ